MVLKYNFNNYALCKCSKYNDAAYVKNHIYCLSSCGNYIHKISCKTFKIITIIKLQKKIFSFAYDNINNYFWAISYDLLKIYLLDLDFNLLKEYAIVRDAESINISTYTNKLILILPKEIIETNPYGKIINFVHENSDNIYFLDNHNLKDISVLLFKKSNNYFLKITNSLVLKPDYLPLLPEYNYISVITVDSDSLYYNIYLLAESKKTKAMHIISINIEITILDINTDSRKELQNENQCFNDLERIYGYCSSISSHKSCYTTPSCIVPNLPQCPDCIIENSKCQIISSIACMEASLSHIINSEGEKIQKAISISTNINELLCINESVRNTLCEVSKLESILLKKLKSIIDYGDFQEL